VLNWNGLEYLPSRTKKSTADLIHPVSDVKACRNTDVSVTRFTDPDPFQELAYPNVLAAKRAIADYLPIPLAKLPPRNNSSELTRSPKPRFSEGRPGQRLKQGLRVTSQQSIPLMNPAFSSKLRVLQNNLYIIMVLTLAG
jgi:hypothetical protein